MQLETAVSSNISNININIETFSCSDCGIPNSGNDTRIVGGDKTEIGEYPWQVIHICHQKDRIKDNL